MEQKWQFERTGSLQEAKALPIHRSSCRDAWEYKNKKKRDEKKLDASMKKGKRVERKHLLNTVKLDSPEESTKEDRDDRGTNTSITVHYRVRL